MILLVLNYVSIYLVKLVHCHVESELYKEKLDNYSIYEVTAFNTRERAVLYTLQVRVDDIMFMNGISNEATVTMDVLVKKGSAHYFEVLMHANDIEYVNVSAEYLIQKIDDISVPQHKHSDTTKNLDLSSQFYCYDQLRLWLQGKVKKHTILKEIIIGQTYEKRDIFVLKLSSGKEKKAVFLMGGEDGRDWSSPAILLNFINCILEKEPNLEILTKYYDFYVLPLFNPDGYTYSISKERLWTKNRKVYLPKRACPKNTSVVGICVDRNWYFNKITVRNEECDPMFMGSKPLYEEETSAVSEFLNKMALKMMAFVNVRGFENRVTIPYGYEKIHCNNYNVLMDMLSAAHESVQRQHNVTFSYGLAAKYMYNFTGTSADWVKKQLNTPIVYTVYMKVEPHILPSAKDVQPLTTQLTTFMKEILLLANTFYGPLFNCHFTHFIHIIVLMLNLCSFIW